MLLLAGQTVEQLITTKVSMSTPIALWTLRKVAETILELHSRRWIHSDTKPENMVVGPNGDTTRTDLGFCRSFDRNHGRSEKQVCGTIAYAAPELLTTALTAIPQSDIYSLGISAKASAIIWPISVTQIGRC
jgi:serine/threonine-protein kinase